MLLCSVTDEKFASVATSEAHKSMLPMKHGCIAVSGGKIIARGCNDYRTYSKDGLIHDTCSCHAEINVLRKCIKQNFKNKINLYIVRVSEEGEYRNSAPCNQCVDTLKQYNIKMIIYSTAEGTLKKCKLVHYTNNHMSGGEKAILHKRVMAHRMGNYIIYKDNLEHNPAK